MVVRGAVRGLATYYSDGVERLEIHVDKSESQGLPCKYGHRVPITLEIGNQKYEAGLRSTANCNYAWICADLRDVAGQKTKLAYVLPKAGLTKNQPVELEELSSKVIEIRSTMSDAAPKGQACTSADLMPASTGNAIACDTVNHQLAGDEFCIEELLANESKRETAVNEFNCLYGEMNRVLWCLSRYCRKALCKDCSLPVNKWQPVVERFIWTIKSWWGVQGVRKESKELMAQALISMTWTDNDFAPLSQLSHEADSFAYQLVLEFVTKSKTERQEFSLASKVLHWLLPWRVPVYDKNVRDLLKVPNRQPAPYREVAGHILRAARALQAEKDTWLGPIEPRCLLHGLDKCLWWYGGGNNGNGLIVRDPWSVIGDLGLEPN